MPLIPQSEPQKASYANDQKTIWREIRALWARTRSGGGNNGDNETIFSFAGAPSVGVQSPIYRIATATRVLSEIVASLGVAGSTSTVVTVYKNGASHTTLTFLASEAYATVAVMTEWTDGDRMTVAVTTAGTGAESVSIQVYWV